jgi:cyclopropane-fatty-acyl-phospholipid synthase
MPLNENSMKTSTPAWLPQWHRKLPISRPAPKRPRDSVWPGMSWWEGSFERRLFERLHKHWHGPPVRVTVANHSYVLGDGEPVAEVDIRRRSLLLKLWQMPILAFGEAYMRGDIEVSGSLRDFMKAIYLTRPEDLCPWYFRFITWTACLPRRISPQCAVANAKYHYNIGNDFYRLWLDPSLTYSCAYFLDETDDLATAQRQKLELLCQKARLAPGQTLLDVGCGWGSLLIHAARRHGVVATGVTPAEDQADFIKALAKREGLEDRVRVQCTGWRAIEGKFDRIISVGMFEHVGLKQYEQFFGLWNELLADGGLSILHCIGRTKPGVSDPWTEKYIFPGGYLPTLAEIADYSARADLCILDVENLKQHYARTLDRWLINFSAVSRDVEAARGPEFSRMWSLYLHGAMAGFRWGDLQLWQTVLAKNRDHHWPLNRQINLDNTS